MNHYDAAIFGAGICGTALANELNQWGWKILLVDPHVSENAPGAPAALVNPATGRRAKLGWRAEQCYGALREQVERLADFNGKVDLISDSGVARPAITEKLAESFRRAIDKYDWPEGWIRWMDEKEMKDFNPRLAPNRGGLLVECGFTVYVDRYLNTYRRYLRERGVDCRYEQAEYRVEGDGYAIQFEGEEVSAGHLIIAAGHWTPAFEEWSELPLEGVKGQIVHFEADEDLDWEHAVSARGYCMRRGARGLVVGSTYEHDFEGLETTGEAYETIRGKLELMLPGVAGRVSRKEQLAGVRVTTQNRLPVIGRHPENEKLLVYTGMNSKGLLFSHYVARLLAGHLTGGDSIPEELDVARFTKK